MKKGILTGIIGLIGLGIGSISMAHDCNLFNSAGLKDWNTTLYPAILKDDPILNALPEEAIFRAMLNLQAHCCATGKSSESSCKTTASDWKNRTNYPQSAFLFDHLVDVLMRRLANDRSYPGLPADKNAKEWHEKVDKLVDSPDGALPLLFQTEHNKYWAIQSNYFLPEYNYTSSVKYPEQIRALEPAEKLKNYKNWSIRTSYYNACSVAVYLNMVLASNNDNSPLQSAWEECKKLTSSMLSREMLYLSNVMTYKSDQLAKDSFQLYANTYHGLRLNNFTTVLNKLSTEWLGVARQVPMLVPMCSY